MLTSEMETREVRLRGGVPCVSGFPFLRKQMSVKKGEGGAIKLEAAQSLSEQNKNLVNNEGFWSLI